MIPTRHTIGAVALATTLTLTGCATDPKPANQPAAPATTRAPLPHLIRGAFVWDIGEGCWGFGQLADITAGAKVTVTDGAGAVIAMGALDAGTVTMQANDKRAELCTWTFKIPDVPSGRGFYAVQVGSLPAEKFPEADLSKMITLRHR